MEWLSDHQWEAWLVLCLIFAAAEMLSLDLVFVMLAGGAGVGALAAVLGAPVLLSALLAAVTAIALLALIRPELMRRLHAGVNLRTGADALVGRRAVVIRQIHGPTRGRVKINGEEWAALAYDEDDRFEPGDIVDVVQITGATAYVLRTNAIGGAAVSEQGE